MSMLQDSSPTGILNGSPKAMFLLGLFVGVSTVTTLCLALLLGLLLSGKSLGAGSALAANTPTAAPTDPYAAPAAPTAPSAPVKPVDEKVDHIRGPKNAKVTLIEYSDFECPFCLRHVASVDQALKDYPKDVRLIYRHFPLSFHPEAQKAAEASECAGAQGKFWEMHDEIFKANQAGTMSVAKWKEIARTLKLDGAKFDKCLDGGEMAARVAQDEQEGAAAGVAGTPATFVNGQMVEGAVPYATLKAAIDAALQS
jgi:protein-disulfide isomerase